MSEVDPGFAYVNARLRAMRTRLLQQSDLDHLLAAPDIETLIGRLDQTTYAEALQQSLLASSGLTAVLRAIHVNLFGTFDRILHFCGGLSARAMSILLFPYARHNVITLLRGIKVLSDPARLTALLIPLKPFSAGSLGELTRSASERDLLDHMKQWGLPTPELAQVLIDARATSDAVTDLETAFNQAWAEAYMEMAASYPGDDGELLHCNAGRSIDLMNLLLAIDLRRTVAKPTLKWLPGILTSDTLAHLVTANDVKAMVDAFDQDPEARFWRFDLEKWTGQREADLQRAWERSLLGWRTGLFHLSDPLGVGIAIAYVAAKEEEARHLRLVAEAVANSLDRHEVAGLLFPETSS